MNSKFKIGDIITWDNQEFGRISSIEFNHFNKLWCEEWYLDKELTQPSDNTRAYIDENEAIFIKSDEPLSLKEELDSIQAQINIFQEMHSDLIKLKELAEKYGYVCVLKKKET